MGPQNTASESFQGWCVTDRQSTDVSGGGGDSRTMGGVGRKLSWTVCTRHQDTAFIRMKGADKALGKIQRQRAH